MIYDTKNCKLHYDVIGEGIPVVLLHGLGCCSALMKGCMEPVFSKVDGYQRIYIELPGMGYSTANQDVESSDAIADILIMFIQHKFKEPCILMGESYGGYLAQKIISKIPQSIQSMVLLCPVVKAIHSQRVIPSKGRVEYDQNFLNTLPIQEREAFCTYSIVANAHTYARFQREVINNAPMDTIFLKELNEHYAFTDDLQARLTNQTLQHPVLILVGKQDVCVGYEDAYALSSLFEHSSFHLLDAAGHNLHLDQEQQFEAITTSWFETHCQVDCVIAEEE